MKEEAFFSYTLSSLCEYRPCLASNSRPGNPGTGSDVDDGHPGHHSPFYYVFSSYRRHTRDRAEIFDDRDRRDDANAVEANRTPPLT